MWDMRFFLPAIALFIGLVQVWIALRPRKNAWTMISWVLVGTTAMVHNHGRSEYSRGYRDGYSRGQFAANNPFNPFRPLNSQFQNGPNLQKTSLIKDSKSSAQDRRGVADERAVQEKAKGQVQ